MEIKVEYKEKLIPEIKYILDILFSDFLRISWRYQQTQSNLFKLSLDGYSGKITMPSIFFENYSLKKFKASSLPNPKCKYLDSRKLSFEVDLIDKFIPVIYGDENQIPINDNNNLYIPIDIFGSSFYMLTLYEEMINYSSAENKYFSASSSYAYKNNFLYRPIVDEYLEIIRSSFSYIWKGIVLKKNLDNKINVTCDIDRLYFYSEDPIKASKELIKNQYWKKIKKDLFGQYKLFFKSLYGDYKLDPFIENIYWIMDQNEKCGNQVTFYFLTQFENKYDGFYRLNTKSLRKVFRDITERNHIIGLHLNYDSFISPEKTLNQYQVFKKIFKEENLYINDVVSRQHYLRWKNPITARNCESANIKIDSTICYPDSPGFKLGTSRDFKYFDLLKREKMSLIERPLIFMENSIFDDIGLGLDYSTESLELIINLKQISLKYGGQFTMLWHNSELSNPKALEFYLEIIK